MGTWDYGIFDDDTAYDFVEEIRHSKNPKAIFKQSFDTVLNSDYVDFTDGHGATVSAAYMDNALNGTQYRNDNEDEEDNVNNFKEQFPDIQLEDLKTNAINALKKVIGEKSELNELWKENEALYSKWKGNIEKLIERLK
jgi:hypothetical protein